jgi:soluble lytic murein transglycosylase-like protein
MQTTGNTSIDKAFTTNAATYGLDPNLIYAISHVETGGTFDPTLQNNIEGGHFGLMQVSTNLLNDSNIGNWKSPQLNTMVGAKYLNYLLKYFDNDMEKAICAYNAGEGTIGGLVRDYGNNWKKHLSPETKKYLPAVLKIYTSLKT